MEVLRVESWNVQYNQHYARADLQWQRPEGLYNKGLQFLNGKVPISVKKKKKKKRKQNL